MDTPLEQTEMARKNYVEDMKTLESQGLEVVGGDTSQFFVRRK